MKANLSLDATTITIKPDSILTGVKVVSWTIQIKSSK